MNAKQTQAQLKAKGFDLGKIQKSLADEIGYSATNREPLSFASQSDLADAMSWAFDAAFEQIGENGGFECYTEKEIGEIVASFLARNDANWELKKLIS